MRRILLAHAVVLGWGGIPVIWMGDELGLPGDPGWADDPAHAGDNRWFHRPHLDPAARALRHDAGSVPGRIFAGLRTLVTCRASLPMLHAAVQSQVLDPGDPGVLLVARSHPEGELLELFNVTESWRPVPAQRLGDLGFAGAPDALSGGTALTVSPDGNVWLAPYRACWLVRD